MIVRRKELLNAMRDYNYLDSMKSGPTAIFFTSKKKDKNGRSIAKTFTLSLWKSFVIAKYKNIPIHIYSLKELKR